MKTEPLHLADGTHDQLVIPSVQPITQAKRDQLALQTRLKSPLTSSKPQKACTLGLFDDDRANQQELF